MPRKIDIDEAQFQKDVSVVGTLTVESGGKLIVPVILGHVDTEGEIAIHDPGGSGSPSLEFYAGGTRYTINFDSSV